MCATGEGRARRAVSEDAFWFQRQTGKTTRLADYVLRTPGAVLVVASDSLVRYVLALRPALRTEGVSERRVLTPLDFGLLRERSLRGRVSKVTEVVIDDASLLTSRQLRDVRLYAEAVCARTRFMVSAQEAGHEPEA